MECRQRQIDDDMGVRPVVAIEWDASGLVRKLSGVVTTAELDSSAREIPGHSRLDDWVAETAGSAVAPTGRGDFSQKARKTDVG